MDEKAPPRLIPFEEALIFFAVHPASAVST